MYAIQQRNTERYFTMNESWSEWLQHKCTQPSSKHYN